MSRKRVEPHVRSKKSARSGSRSRSRSRRSDKGNSTDSQDELKDKQKVTKQSKVKSQKDAEKEVPSLTLDSLPEKKGAGSPSTPTLDEQPEDVSPPSEATFDFALMTQKAGMTFDNEEDRKEAEEIFRKAHAEIMSCYRKKTVPSKAEESKGEGSKETVVEISVGKVEGVVQYDESPENGPTSVELSETIDSSTANQRKEIEVSSQSVAHIRQSDSSDPEDDEPVALVQYASEEDMTAKLNQDPESQDRTASDTLKDAVQEVEKDSETEEAPRCRRPSEEELKTSEDAAANSTSNDGKEDSQLRSKKELTSSSQDASLASDYDHPHLPGGDLPSPVKKKDEQKAGDEDALKTTPSRKKKLLRVGPPQTVEESNNNLESSTVDSDNENPTKKQKKEKKSKAKKNKEKNRDASVDESISQKESKKEAKMKKKKKKKTKDGS